MSLSNLLNSEALASPQSAESKSEGKPFMHQLPPLPYPYDALEPVIDKQTVEIHYTKHFAAYVAGLNTALEKLDKSRKEGNFDNIKCLSEDLAFNGSGVVLHWIYFSTIGPKAGGEPSGAIADLIKRDFGSYEAFWKQFSSSIQEGRSVGMGSPGVGTIQQAPCHPPVRKASKPHVLGGDAPHGMRRLGTRVLSEISKSTSRLCGCLRGKSSTGKRCKSGSTSTARRSYAAVTRYYRGFSGSVPGNLFRNMLWASRRYEKTAYHNGGGASLPPPIPLQNLFRSFIRSRTRASVEPASCRLE